MSISIERVSTERFTMPYFRFGNGARTLVILPGVSVQSVMNAADAVAAAYACMTEAFTVYVFERREALPDRFTVQDMARDTAEALSELGLNNVYLFGASMGGMIALCIATEHPELVRKLVLGSTSACVTAQNQQGLERWIQLAKNRDAKGLYLTFGEAIYPKSVFEQNRDAFIDAAKSVTDTELDRFIILINGIKDFCVLDQLSKIRCPVLAIGSQDDAVFGPDATAQIGKALEQSGIGSCCFYDGYGHAAYDTAPDYKDRMLQFFVQA